MKAPMDIGLPDKISLQEYPDYIHISRKWFGTHIILMTLFALFWNTVLIGFYAGMDDNAGPMARLFPIIHVAVGIWVSYYALAGWLNTSHVYVSKDTIEINHKPLPWVGNKKLKSTALKQLYAREKISHNKNGTTVTYEVRAILKEGQNIKLLSGLKNSEQALFIEQEIEKYLQIENVPVKGAVN